MRGRAGGRRSGDRRSGAGRTGGRRSGDRVCGAGRAGGDWVCGAGRAAKRGPAKVNNSVNANSDCGFLFLKTFKIIDLEKDLVDILKISEGKSSVFSFAK
ncbi:hypothetical protein KIL84_018363, partial [Mauremys mutica]